MKLNSLKLENYRNYTHLSLQFDPATTYIVGNNAQGKTNILEAIYLLSLTKSFRTTRASDLIKWDKEYTRVQADFDDMQLEVFLGIPPQPNRSLKKNGVKTTAENFIGNCQTVFFHPEDLNMLYLGPDLRRRYLDILNLQISKDYYRALRSYKRVLTQRNSLLKAIKQGFSAVGDLDIWDDQLVEHGNIIIDIRAKTIDFINEHIQHIYRKISQNDEMVEAQYMCSELKLEESRKRDLEAQFTTVGPHRDDIEFRLNEKPLGSHASRGEYRSLLLALKLIELQFHQDKTGQKPLLLLDDVFSELDFDRQSMLTEAIEGHQTIITATHIDTIINERMHGGLKLRLEKGAITTV